MLRISAFLIASGALVLPPAVAVAEGDFTFRRVGVPAHDAGPRITVRIALRPQAEVETPAKPADEATAGPSPAAGQLARIAASWGREIARATAGTRISPALALAVMSAESAGRADALSPAGALGLMQLMPATAERFGVTDRLEPAGNIRGGVAYLDWLASFFAGDPDKILAGYNAGEGAVLRYGGVPPYAETQEYVPKVLAAFDLARTLCKVPPDRISDECEFLPWP